MQERAAHEVDWRAARMLSADPAENQNEFMTIDMIRRTPGVLQGTSTTGAVSRASAAAGPQEGCSRALNSTLPSSLLREVPVQHHHCLMLRQRVQYIVVRWAKKVASWVRLPDSTLRQPTRLALRHGSGGGSGGTRL